MTLPRLFPAFAAILILGACNIDPPPDAATDVLTGTDSSDASTEIGGADIAVVQDAVDLPNSDPDASCATLGCFCEDDRECDSGYCIEGIEAGEFICSAFCIDDCGDPEFECVLLENSGGDSVRLCVPAADRQCQPCERDRDCGGTTTVCTELLDGTFCAIPCFENGGCPSGNSCEPVLSNGESVEVCLPNEGVCSDCYDPDLDGYGVGRECRGGDCDEEEAGINEGASEVCDSVDQDCDGWTDEDFDFETDVDNCGGCNIRCSADDAVSVCTDGLCGIGECNVDWGDCNSDQRDGCETDLTAPDSCGTCAAIGGLPGTICGTCDEGLWACNDDGTADCADDPGVERLNGCGGCNGLEGPVGENCGTCGSGGWICNGSEFVVCSGDLGELAHNECGGCTIIAGDAGTPCGTCGTGLMSCVSLERLACDGDRGPSALNACLGCGFLRETPGESCGTCDAGEWACDGTDAVACAGDPGVGALSACGGCTVLAAEPETACGTCGSGEWTCAGTDALICAGDAGSEATNPCGGCEELDGEPSDACGPCGLDRLECLAPDSIACNGSTAVNVCGGCTELEVEPETVCGACGAGVFVCDAGSESTTCVDGPNCPPTQPLVEIVPAFPTALDALACQVVVESIDPEGDGVSYGFVWERGGVGAGPESDTVPAAELALGDEWLCQAMPTDGTDDGAPGRSSAVTIGDPCEDELLDGNETDVDCGGAALTIAGAPHTCDRCAVGDDCLLDGDCAAGAYCDGVCTAWACLPSTNFCSGGDVHLCDGRGSSSSFVEACLLGCEGGSCIAGCGDGAVGLGEACDDGLDNSDVTADSCRTDCSWPRCGDAVVDGGESCDDGGLGGCTEDCSEAATGSSCLGLRALGTTVDGVYSIDPDGVGPLGAQSLYCDMTTDGGGWTLTYIVRNDLPSASNPYWPQVVPGSGTSFPTAPARPTGYFQGPTLATRSSLFTATASTEWRATHVTEETVLFDVKSGWTGSTGIGLRCFATGQGSCTSISQTCSSSSTDATVLLNTSGTPISAGGTGYVCDVGWSDCTFCVDWSSIRTDASAGGSTSSAYRYTGDTSLSIESTQTYYWIR